MGVQLNRRVVGLQRDGVFDGPLMPALKTDSETMVLHEETDEHQQFLDCQDVSSHSLKCTMLSWCSKYGLPKEVRAALGRHSSATQGSDTLYPRDLAVEPVRQLQHVFDSIASGSFNPDGKRSEYISDLWSRWCHLSLPMWLLAR